MSALSMTPRIRSISLNKYAQVAQEFGLDPLRMLRQAGLDHSCLNSPDLQVPETAFAQMLETSSAHAGNAALGLLMGAYWKLSDFGPISLLLQHQASLAALLQTLKDYPHLISSTITTEIVTQQRLSIIQLHLRTERDTPGRHPMELGIAALLSLCRHQLGRDWNPVSVHFTHSAPASSAQHRRVLGCETVFASHFDGIVLSNQDGYYLDYEQGHEASDVFSSERCVGRHLTDVLPPEIARRMLDEVRAVLDSQRISSLDYELPLASDTAPLRARHGEHAVPTPVRHFEARLVATGADEA